jgi:hypothetical protein
VIEDYGRFHRNPANLIIHIIAVPVFVVGSLAAIWMLLTAQVVTGFLLLAVPALSLAIQGYGHRFEALPPRPFTSPGNFIRRILAEQFLGFWAYLLSGHWFRAIKASKGGKADG